MSENNTHHYREAGWKETRYTHQQEPGQYTQGDGMIEDSDLLQGVWHCQTGVVKMLLMITRFLSKELFGQELP